MTQKIRFLSCNTLKILAAIFMVFDHMGLMFFPDKIIFRIIGRLSYPIFAFMISEGARYTKNRLRYFLTIFSLATLCQTVYYFFDSGSLYMSILVTFSLSILMIYAVQAAKWAIFTSNAPTVKRILYPLLMLISFAGVYLLNQILTIDYGFVGCIAPVFASLFDFRGMKVPEILQKCDTLTVRVLVFGIAILILSLETGGIQLYSLLSVVLLLLYSGNRGKYRMKYFFYVFYPAHLVILEGIYLLIYYLR